jgi:FKBP-type peptidyl-prolyl cis-trans isomerase 2
LRRSYEVGYLEAAEFQDNLSFAAFFYTLYSQQKKREHAMGRFGIALLIVVTSFMVTVPFITRGENMTIQEGSKVSFDYTLTVNEEVIDTSQGKDPLTYTHGNGQIIPGLEKALIGLEVGEEKVVEVAPEDAYGVVNPRAFQVIPKKSLPQDIEPKAGMFLAMQAPNGESVPVRISEVNDDSVVIDLNHPLAGKTLNFRVKIVSIE